MNLQHNSSYTKNNHHQHIINLTDKLLKRARRGLTEGGIFYISIDDMPLIISSEGYEFACFLIEDLCNNIKKDLLGKNDYILHVDIDHLNLVLDDYNPEQLEEIAAKIYRYIISYGCTKNNNVIQLTATIGGADFSKLTDNADNIIGKSFIALNDAKEAGEHYILYTDSKLHEVTSKHHMVLANYIQTALLGDKLCLAYQPIINIKTNKPLFYEGLLRIVDEHGMASTVGPFIPIVEKMGFIDVIDGVALKLAVAELEKYPNLSLSVNVSSLTVQHHKWIDMAVRLLTNKNIASRLILEITETSEYHDMDSLMHFIKELKQVGCQIAIDDFGTGYTSFAQIRTLPIDIIKIDGSFVKDMVTNKDNHAFVEALAMLGNKLKIKTLAEFVESKAILNELKKMPIDYAQGHYFAPASRNKPWASNPTND